MEDVPFHPRRLLELLRAWLASRPITVLTGARQTGKTTFVRNLLPAGGDPPTVYLSLATIPTSVSGSRPTPSAGLTTARLAPHHSKARRASSLHRELATLHA
jgi:hypothetical protein